MPRVTTLSAKRNDTLVQADLQRELLYRYSIHSTTELVHLVIVQSLHFSSSFLSYFGIEESIAH